LLQKPWGKERQVLALKLVGEGNEACARFPAATLGPTPARPAIASLIVDQVIDRELVIGGYFAPCDDFDPSIVESKKHIRVAGVIEIALWTRDEKEPTVDQGTMLCAFIEIRSKGRIGGDFAPKSKGAHHLIGDQVFNGEDARLA